MAEMLFAICLGLLFGSFSSALIYRIPRQLPWTNVRSMCTACQKPLGAFDLIPVLSWVMNKRCCRYCSAPVPAIYPALEIVSACLCALVVALHGGTAIEKYSLVAALPFLTALIVIDLQHKILPNILVLIVAGISGIVLIGQAVLSSTSIAEIVLPHLIGMLAFTVLALFLKWLMKALLKKEALGMGDVKFFAVAGLWLGIEHLAVFCMVSGILGVTLAVVWQKLFKEDVFPFGPALIMAFLMILLLDGSLLFEKTINYLSIMH